LKSKFKLTFSHPNQLEQAFERYYPAIFRYFRYRGADADTSDDLASAVFERALANLQSYDSNKSQIQTWLFAIARNLASNHWKAESNHPTTSLDDFESIARDDPPLEENLILGQDKQDILWALQTLDKLSIEMIALKFGGCLTNYQIAELTHVNHNYVGVILYRALLKLRAILVTRQSETDHERK
jgi:RNA polymerase sigma-70 factor (ECF subfamily)